MIWEHNFSRFLWDQKVLSKSLDKIFLPSNIRSQLRVEYDKSRNQLNKETATQLESCFPDVTCQQEEQLFKSWEKQSKKSLITPPTISLS